jgi:hypothetical protein
LTRSEPTLEEDHQFVSTNIHFKGMKRRREAEKEFRASQLSQVAERRKFLKSKESASRDDAEKLIEEPDRYSLRYLSIQTKSLELVEGPDPHNLRCSLIPNSTQSKKSCKTL